MKLYTHTFIENQYFKIRGNNGAPEFEYVPHDSERALPLDEQIRAWVEATGHEIVNQGTIGMHKEQFYQGTLLCVSLALSVLYKPNGNPDEFPAYPAANPLPDSHEHAPARGA
jgi:hypothetical protein